MAAWYRLVGTSHIASQSIREVRRAFEEWTPDVVAVELDPARLHALLTEAKPSYSPKMIRVIGVRGYLFALIGSLVQRQLGRIVGVSPGSDMLAAVRLAHKEKRMLLLVDQDLQVTLRRLSKAMGWKELRQFFKDVWDSLVHKERVTINLNEVPESAFVDRLLELFGSRYPRPYAVLVEERNRHMVRALQAYHERHPEQKILVVVGAGHRAGMLRLLEDARVRNSEPI
jgi:pheromone shutdown protein TraB